ncbi:MAG TPA: glycosyltransferase [Rhodocyclaceae bacterium]|nr:glycosyltransferase [Rhodocyclaceae bacterium]
MNCPAYATAAAGNGTSEENEVLDMPFTPLASSFTALGPRRTGNLRLALVAGAGSEEATESAQQLAANFVELGYTVQLFCPHRRGDRESLENRPGYREIPLPALPLPGGFARVWQAEEVDAVYILGVGSFGLVAALAAKQCALPVSFAPSMTNTIQRPFWHRALCTLADEAIATESSQAQRLREQGCRRVRVVPEGIDLQSFNPRQRSHSLRYQWGVRADTPVLAHVGPVHDPITADYLRATMDALLETVPDARLLLIQAGRIPAQLQALRPLRGETCRHRTTGWPGSERESSLAVLLASADLLMVANSDHCPSLIPLAQACGMAVIARHDERSHLHLEDSHNGFLVGNEDVEANCTDFSNTVRHALAAPLALAKLRLRAPASIAHLERRRTADQLAATLAEMARTHARRRCNADAWIIPVADF